jgi:hypothetical protein
MLEATLRMLMFRRQARRLNTTIFVVFALLFSQLALANYVCASQPAQTALAVMSTMEMAPGMPCDEMGAASDKGQSVLCQQHCTNAPQSVDHLNVTTVSLPAVLHVFVVSPLLDAGAGASAIHAEAGQFRPPPDPIFLSTLRLRV